MPGSGPDTLPTDLAARFAALRSPSHSDSSEADLEARLRALEPPSSKEPPGIQVQVNDLGDEAVDRYLTLLTAPGAPPEPLNNESRVNKTSVHDKIPCISESALDTLSGIEIEFMKRPGIGSTDPGKHEPFEGVDNHDELDLIARIQDEVEVEQTIETRQGQTVDTWQTRFEKLKQQNHRPRSYDTNSEISTTLGPVPEVGDLERAVSRTRRRRNPNRSRRTDDSESDDSESTDSGSSVASRQ